MKIYIGNIPYSTTEDDLQNAFGSYGEVTSAIIIKDKMSGRSKGFGFVEMSDDNAAKSAISGLDGSDMGGRAMSVKEAIPKT